MMNLRIIFKSGFIIRNADLEQIDNNVMFPIPSQMSDGKLNVNKVVESCSPTMVLS